jgi:hypothetical protein
MWWFLFALKFFQHRPIAPANTKKALFYKAFLVFTGVQAT